MYYTKGASASASASAITFSIIEIAKENGLEYLEYLFTHIQSTTSNELKQYMLWSKALPDNWCSNSLS